MLEKTASPMLPQPLMSDLITESFIDYQLLDSADGRKCEKIGDLIVERPCPQAIWTHRLHPKAWEKLQAQCLRKKDGGGEWKFFGKKAAESVCRWSSKQAKDFHFKLKLTSFGHCGIFFEQAAIWNQIEAFIQQQKQQGEPSFLNLFGYTGAATMVAAKSGAHCRHVDSAKGVLNWTRENAELNKLQPERLQLIHEDALTYVRNAQKRGLQFDGILLDPPSWGHGVKKEVWNFDENLSQLMSALSKILKPQNSFIILTSHTHGVQAQALKNVLTEQFRSSQITCGELGLRHANDARILPAGIYAMAVRDLT